MECPFKHVGSYRKRMTKRMKMIEKIAETYILPCGRVVRRGLGDRMMERYMSLHRKKCEPCNRVDLDSVGHVAPGTFEESSNRSLLIKKAMTQE